MEFTAGFLKINQETDISLAQYLTEYDITNGTMHALTVNYEETMLAMLKQNWGEYLSSLNFGGIGGVSKKIEHITQNYHAFLTKNNQNIAIGKIISHLKANNKLLYVKYTLHCASAAWQCIGVYDANHNFITRRLRLAGILNKEFKKLLP